MSLFDENLQVIMNQYPEIYTLMQDYTPGENIGCAETVNGEYYLALSQSDRMYIMGSTYDPEHESERFCEQYASLVSPVSLVMFGMGLGYIAEALLNKPEICKMLYIYEPSVDIFYAAMSLRNLAPLLMSDRIHLCVGDIHKQKFLNKIEKDMTFHNWNEFQYTSLSKYEELFGEISSSISSGFQRIQSHKHTDYNTLVLFSKSSVTNEIHFFRYLMKAKNLYDIKPFLTPEVPCIVVAAGPSLEKNVEQLKQAKGKAFIFCADRAAKYLVERGIIPDMICTIDANKPTFCFEDERLNGIPVAIISESNYKLLDCLEQSDVMCFGRYPEFHERILESLGVQSEPIDLGGSVALSQFRLAVELGFRTIILVGQDLAFGTASTHAGETDAAKQPSGIWVEGYYGGMVSTRKDFKIYLDIYNQWIPEIPDVKVVNATEGGARVQGTVQMPLQEAIQTLCQQEFNITDIISEIPYIVSDDNKRQYVYHELEKHIQEVHELKPMVKKALMQTRDELANVKMRKIQPSRLQRVNEYNDQVLNRVRQSEASDMLYRCMMQTEETITDALSGEEGDPVQEIVNLYNAMIGYLAELQEVLDCLIQTWEEVIQWIKDNYFQDE